MAYFQPERNRPRASDQPTGNRTRNRRTGGAAARATKPETNDTRRNKFSRNKGKTSTYPARKGGLSPFSYLNHIKTSTTALGAFVPRFAAQVQRLTYAAESNDCPRKIDISLKRQIKHHKQTPRPGSAAEPLHYHRIYINAVVAPCGDCGFAGETFREDGLRRRNRNPSTKAIIRPATGRLNRRTDRSTVTIPPRLYRFTVSFWADPLQSRFSLGSHLRTIVQPPRNQPVLTQHAKSLTTRRRRRARRPPRTRSGKR